MISLQYRYPTCIYKWKVMVSIKWNRRATISGTFGRFFGIYEVRLIILKTSFNHLTVYTIDLFQKCWIVNNVISSATFVLGNKPVIIWKFKHKCGNILYIEWRAVFTWVHGSIILHPFTILELSLKMECYKSQEKMAYEGTITFKRKEYMYLLFRLELEP